MYIISCWCLSYSLFSPMYRYIIIQFTIKNVQHLENFSLKDRKRSSFTTEPSQLKPSNPALFLQSHSRPSSDFLAKISDDDTPLFLSNTQFYFPLSPLLIRKAHKRTYLLALNSRSIGSILATV